VYVLAIAAAVGGGHQAMRWPAPRFRQYAGAARTSGAKRCVVHTVEDPILAAIYETAWGKRESAW